MCQNMNLISFLLNNRIYLMITLIYKTDDRCDRDIVKWMLYTVGDAMNGLLFWMAVLMMESIIIFYKSTTFDVSQFSFYLFIYWTNFIFTFIYLFILTTKIVYLPFCKKDFLKNKIVITKYKTVRRFSFIAKFRRKWP